MVSRRNFLKALAAGIVWYPFRDVVASLPPERSLSLYNIHTGEHIAITYYASGSYDYAALTAIDRFLRCHYTDEIMPIDTRLLDLLGAVVDRAGAKGPVQIISGYRSPKYNDYLRSIGRKVSKNSLHLQGIAIDFTLPGIGNRELFSVARSFAAGGVGYYPEFVHIDTGRVRYW
ncbi:MAG: DUF882 domain-containing protein [Nitrospirota bacterium]